MVSCGGSKSKPHPWDVMKMVIVVLIGLVGMVVEPKMMAAPVWAGAMVACEHYHYYSSAVDQSWGSNDPPPPPSPK